MGLGLRTRSNIFLGRGGGVRIIIIGGVGEGFGVRFVGGVHRTSTGLRRQTSRRPLLALAHAVIFAAALGNRVKSGGRRSFHLGDSGNDGVVRHPGREHVFQGGGDGGHSVLRGAGTKLARQRRISTSF